MQSPTSNALNESKLTSKFQITKFVSIGNDGELTKKQSIDSSYYEAHMQIKNPEFSLIKEKVVVANMSIRQMSIRQGEK